MITCCIIFVDFVLSLFYVNMLLRVYLHLWIKIKRFVYFILSQPLTFNLTFSVLWDFPILFKVCVLYYMLVHKYTVSSINDNEHSFLIPSKVFCSLIVREQCHPVNMHKKRIANEWGTQRIIIYLSTHHPDRKFKSWRYCSALCGEIFYNFLLFD